MRVRVGLAVTSVVWAFGTLAVLACGSTSSGGGGGGGGTPDSGHHGSASGSGSGSGNKGSGDGSVSAPSDAEVSACNASAQALCALLSQCNPLVLAGDYADGGDCVGRELTNCELGLTVPNTASTPAHTTACAAAEMTESCADYLNLNPPSACAQVMGATANSGACSHPGQCATGFCGIVPGTACGTCQPAPTAGASCAELTTCGATLDCYKGTCIAYVATVNGACSATQPCGAGLGCVIPGGGAAGTCRALGTTTGATCDPKSQTAAGCDPDKSLTCVSETTVSTYKTCQPEVAATSGMPCGNVDGFQSYCLNATCERLGDAGLTCVARAADGQPCNSLVGPQCTIPARCVGTVLDGGASGACQLQSPCP